MVAFHFGPDDLRFHAVPLPQKEVFQPRPFSGEPEIYLRAVPFISVVRAFQHAAAKKQRRSVGIDKDMAEEPVSLVSRPPQKYRRQRKQLHVFFTVQPFLFRRIRHSSFFAAAASISALCFSRHVSTSSQCRYSLYRILHFAASGPCAFVSWSSHARAIRLSSLSIDGQPFRGITWWT